MKKNDGAQFFEREWKSENTTCLSVSDLVKTKEIEERKSTAMCKSKARENVHKAKWFKMRNGTGNLSKWMKMV